MNDQQKLLIEMIMRQTSYTFEEAELQLEKHDNNYMKVIKTALGINKPEKTKEKSTVNQQIYKEIRGFMDNGSKNFLMNQERQRKQQEVLSHIAEQKKAQELLKKQNNKLESLEEEGVEESEVSPSEINEVSPSEINEVSPSEPTTQTLSSGL